MLLEQMTANFNCCIVGAFKKQKTQGPLTSNFFPPSLQDVQPVRIVKNRGHQQRKRHQRGRTV